MDKKNTIRSGSKGRGSALILVVVVTVLLAMVGIMFLMVSRVGDMMGTAARQEHELDQAVGTVTTKIERILMEDLFGPALNPNVVIANGKSGSNESYDAPGTADPWLASLEPVFISDNGTAGDPTDDLYTWPYISNIWHSQINFGDMFWDRVLRDGVWPSNNNREWGAIVPDYQDLKGYYITPADADGDGVADSLWIPALDGPNGEKIYVAVRIIDNCAMLNLNTAHMTRIASGWTGQGRWLGEVDYERFLRGADRGKPETIRQARMCNPNVIVEFQPYHEEAILYIENPYEELLRKWEEEKKTNPNAPKPSPVYNLFDMNDELEIRNRFCLTGLAQARFEKQTNTSLSPKVYGLYETFDFERGDFIGGWDVELRVKRIPVDSSNDLRIWKQRMNPENFDDTSPWESTHNYGYYYDRRHACTFYSFDRNLRAGGDPALAAMTADEQEIYKKIFMPGDGHAVSVRADILSNSPQARRHILHLLYAFRAYYLGKNDPLPTAARKSAQVVANMIDYLDDSTAGSTGPFSQGFLGGQMDASPTYINKQIINQMIAETTNYLVSQGISVPVYLATAIPAVFDFGLASTDVIYGFECQPFFTDLYTRVDNNSSPPNNVQAVAMELVWPYLDLRNNPPQPFDLSNWRLRFWPRSGNPVNLPFPSGSTIPAATSDTQPGRLVIHTNAIMFSSMDTNTDTMNLNTMLAQIWDANSIELQRPDPAKPSGFITVDRIQRAQIEPLLSDSPAANPTHHILLRDDNAWKFTHAGLYQVPSQQIEAPANSTALTARLGNKNNLTLTGKGYQMPVADIAPPLPNLPDERRFFTLGDFQKVLFVGNQGGSDPNTVTSAVAAAAKEGDIRFDILQNPELLGYICFLNRPQGSLPGRININTAPKHVLAAAIVSAIPAPDFDIAYPIAKSYAQAIVDRRAQVGFTGYTNLGALLNLPQWNIPTPPSTGDDTSIIGDLQDRDGLIANMSNIFTARSDVFTAYILVRLGPSGPQRRVMAIFDRSQVWTPEDRPRIVAIKTVPNPR